MGGGRTDVGAVDEAEEVEEGDGREDVEVDLEAEARLGLAVGDHLRLGIPRRPAPVSTNQSVEKRSETHLKLTTSAPSFTSEVPS